MHLTFGGYCLNVSTRQLLRGKSEVRLSPKAFDLLHMLVENRMRAVSKTELHDRLWPGTFVTDANLTVLVAELRNALHDRPDAPRFVRTVRGFGYAFCGQVDDHGYFGILYLQRAATIQRHREPVGRRLFLVQGTHDPQQSIADVFHDSDRPEHRSHWARH